MYYVFKMKTIQLRFCLLRIVFRSPKPVSFTRVSLYSCSLAALSIGVMVIVWEIMSIMSNEDMDRSYIQCQFQLVSSVHLDIPPRRWRWSFAIVCVRLLILFILFIIVWSWSGRWRWTVTGSLLRVQIRFTSESYCAGGEHFSGRLASFRNNWTDGWLFMCVTVIVKASLKI